MSTAMASTAYPLARSPDQSVALRDTRHCSLAGQCVGRTHTAPGQKDLNRIKPQGLTASLQKIWVAEQAEGRHARNK